MAKRLLLNVLVKVLGEFIELNEENLNLAVWSGQIVLTNLTLKTEHILKNFNLNVFHGSIQRLEVTIPWATLLINPVKIVIDGILLDVGPLDIAKLGKVEALKRYMAEKLQKLKMVDQYLELSLNLKPEEASPANNNPNSETYIQQWTTKIIDNIEIKVTDLHIRYEDSLSMPGKVFACGLTLNSFGISTSDSNWSIGAAKKTGANADPGAVYKLAYLKCLGIYWQVEAASLASMPLKEWENVMMQYIVKEDWTLPGASRETAAAPPTGAALGDRGMQMLLARAQSKQLILQQSNSQTKEYILSPYNNSLTLKLKQNKKPTQTAPKFDICAESSNLQIHLDSLQYVELFSVVDRLGALGRMFKPRTYRPNERPYNRRTSIAWWKYACRLAIRSRKYVDLVKLSLRLAAGREDPHEYLPPYAAAEVRYLEERLPFEPLRVGRQRAMLELQEEVKQAQKMQTRPALERQQGTWWGSWSNSSGNNTPVKPAGEMVRSDEDISIESILAALNEPENASQKPAVGGSSTTDVVVSMIRFSLQSSSTALISTAFRPIVQCNSALSLSFTKTSAGMTFLCELQDLLVLDRFTQDPPVPYIVSVKSDLSYVQRTHQYAAEGAGGPAKPTFSLYCERISGKSRVVIAALPVEVCLNKECIQMVLNSFARPENKYAEKVTAKKAAPSRPGSALTTAQMGIQNLRSVSQNNDDIQIVFAASAPKIIIPESSEDSGYVLLDCGYLEVKGFLGSSGMSMNVGLSHVSVGMPMTVRDMYKFGDKALYLIKPFDIVMHVQNIDQVIAGLTVDVEIKPEIRGEIDSVKLARLLTALGQVSGMFAKLPPPPGSAEAARAMLSPATSEPQSRSKLSSTPLAERQSGLKAPIAVGSASGAAAQVPARFSAGHPLSIDSPGADLSNADLKVLGSPDSVEFHTPQRVSLASQTAMSASSRSGAASVHDETYESYGQFEECRTDDGESYRRGPGSTSKSLPRTPQRIDVSRPGLKEGTDKAGGEPRSPEAAAQPDPNVSNMRIDVHLPMVALDLAYDVQKGYHLVLEVRSMCTTLTTRPLDRSIVFEMGAMSMHDDFRAEAQSHLAWTPPESGKLVTISYVNLFSRKSPLYRSHATDIVMHFSNLGLNVDANTIKHLRPFFEVLLSSRQPPNAESPGGSATPPPQASASTSAANLGHGMGAGAATNSAAASAEVSSTSLAAILGDDTDLPPTGTCLHASLERISLDFLRTPLVEQKGALLESAFSAQISGMRCDVTMQVLMKAEVRLRSFEILDIRNISSDYVFKKVFCPAFEEQIVHKSTKHPTEYESHSFDEMDTSLSSIGQAYSVNNIDSGDHTPFSAPVACAHSPSARKRGVDSPHAEKNLLFVVFRQESRVHNHFDILFSDVTSFIAIDTILDLTNVALANVFALFSLLAAPVPQQPASPPATVQATAAGIVANLADKMFTPDSKLTRTNSLPKDAPAESEVVDIGNTMSVVLRVRNPRLIFLDDPSSEESQAIVGTCGVEVNYTRETKTRPTSVSLFESLHVTLSKYEVYVLKSMTKWYPQPILEPVEVELHLKKRSVDGVTKMMNVHIELDNVVTQVSFNDILLAQSILSRRMLSEAPAATESPPPPAAGAAASSAPAAASDSGFSGKQAVSSDAAPLGSPAGRAHSASVVASPPPADAQSSVVSFQFGMSMLSMVVINDFNGQCVPIIKATISNSNFGVESIGPKMDGIGAVDAKVDFFNTRLSTWEPILDMWQPTARIYCLNDAKIFEVKSDYTMQLTVSGIVLETLLRSYSLFFHDLDVLAERTALAGIVVSNHLGDGVEVELLDSGTKEKLVSLPAGQTRMVTSTREHVGKIWSQATNLPSAVDLHFVGRFKSQRQPLFHLPFKINKPKAYNLQPTPLEEPSPHSETADSVWTTKASSKVYVIEPIVEEVYENSRYDPIMGCWRKPYMMGDPHEWTDGSGTVRRDIGSIELTSDRWEWQGSWEIDMDGEVGKDFDAHGWEYASSFNFFTMVSLRRSHKALDGCRRRRWTRTRIPVATFTSLLERPLTLFWDVRANKDGSRTVDLRSALQISNQLSYPIMLCLEHSAWDRVVELGPVDPDAVFSIPLLYSYATGVRVRPAAVTYEWSQLYPCTTHAYDFSTTKSGTCVGKEASASPTWFRVMTTQVNKSVLVSIVPYITVTNKLLCDMRFVCADRDGKAEEGEIESGCSKKLSFINSSNNPMLSIKVGNFEWSERTLLCTTGDAANLFELHLPGRRKATKLHLSVNSKCCPTRGIHIEIFSKVAVIDRTALQIFVASKLRPGVNLVRSTCASLRMAAAPNASADLPPGTVRERLDSVDSLGTVSTLKSPVTDSTIHEPWGLSLKFPGGGSQDTSANVSGTSSPRKDSRHRLLSHEGVDALAFAPAVSNPIVNTYTYTSSFPETPTVRVDSSVVLQPTQHGAHAVVQGQTTQPTIITEGKTSGHGGASPHAKILVCDIEVSSRNKYHLMQTTGGQRVYSDHPMRWCHLPPFLNEQLQLRTPHEDRLQRANKLVQFTTTAACMLFVLLDVNATIKWLLPDGFIKIREIATARCVVRGVLEEVHFVIYGKLCAEGQRVTLKSCWNKTALTMYSVFVLPVTGATETVPASDGIASAKHSGPPQNPESEPSSTSATRAESLDSVLRQLQFRDTYSREMATRCWTEGSNSLSLMYSYDNLVTVGLCKGKIWSREINIDTRKNAATKGSFEVDNIESGISYQLSYGLHALPGLYSETQLIYFMPRYCILNCTEEVLLVSQRGSEKYLQYLPYRPEGWHKLELESGTEVQLRTASSLWSLGAVDINDIGSSVLFVPHRDDATAESGAGSAPRFLGGTVLHVEVKLADPTDNCSIIVIIWQETIEARPAMTIRNTSDVAVTVRQADIEMDHEIQNQEHLFEICVPPGTAVPFGWADPESGTDVLIAVGEGLKGQNKRIASINLLKTEQLMRLPYNFGHRSARGEVVISVTTNNSGHVLEVSNLRSSAYIRADAEVEGGEGVAEVMEDIEARQRNLGFPTYGFNFLLSSFGVSIVVEKPQRREFLSLYIDWLEVLARFKGSMRSLEFVVMDLQVDNYSETMIYPVLLRSRKKEIRRSVALSASEEEQNTLAGRARQESTLLAAPSDEGSESPSGKHQRKPDEPFIKFTIIQEIPADGSQAIFKYVACRVLPLAVEVDSATVQLLFTDLLDDLKILTHSQALALSMPDRWLNEFNYEHLYPQQQLRMVDVYRSKIQAQQSKMYFKNLIIHPIKVTFTFAQTTYPRRQQKETLQSTVLNVLMSLVGVEKLRLHLRSFEVADAMESIRTLSDMVVSKSIQDVRSQLTQIAGSLTMLGSPIGFARRVGSGVKAFFYEPYQGAVHGSQDFFIGLGRGTSTLFTGVVSGAMDSAVAIVGTATKGMSHLSGDADFVRKRALKRQQNKVNRGGILEGIREGGESLLSGITSGVSGLVSKPIEEASKGGFQGFFKGLGLGLIGAAVKPVIGLSDGLTSVAQGISNQVDPGVKTAHVRPPRALEPSDVDRTNLIIVPLNLEAAFAQEQVAIRAKQNHYDDYFLRYIPLETKGEAIILSNIYVYWRRRSSLWGRIWANISHCVYMIDAVGIMLYSGGEKGGACLVTIPCKTVQTAKRVYAALAQNTSRMGNPSNVIPVDIVMKAGTITPSGSRDQDLHTLLRDGRRITQSTTEALRMVVDESLLGALDGYRFGSANGAILNQITGSEEDVLKRATHHLEKEIGSWQRVDQHIWRLLWEWGCIHSNLSACRCSVTVLINRSDSPIQITRVQLVMGRNVLIIGSNLTGYEVESRSLLPEGMIVVFICAFPESPLDIGHLKANINTAAFSAAVASTQRESFCEAKGGFTVGFLEKTVSDWWSKYVIVIS